MRPFLIWLCLVRHLRPDLLIHECTRFFDVGLLKENLGDLFMIESTNITPELLGIPQSRNRRYTVLINKGTCVWLSNLREFEMLFSRTMELDGDSYFMAPEELVRSTFSEQLQRKGFQPLQDDDDLKDFDWSMIYTPSTRGRLQKYRSHRQQHQSPEGTFIVNLQQNYGHEVCGPMVPCLLTKPIIFSFSHCCPRHLLPDEVLQVQGFPIFGSAAKDYELPWGAALATLRPTQKLELAGNGMQMEVVSTLLVFCIANISKQVATPKTMRAVTFLDEEVWDSIE